MRAVRLSRLALTFGCLLGCTFGGSDEDPTRLIDIDGGDEELDADTSPDAESESDASGSHERDAQAPESCMPTDRVAVCDPVRNTGCALTQCDVDTEAATLAGRCVFYQPALGATCSANALSETCEAQHTCVEGTCRKLCWCKQDCPAGECCQAAPKPGLGAGFKLCGPC